MAYDPCWEIEGSLARPSRPGYPGKSVSPQEVDDWLRKVNSLGVKSIICLLSEEQLGFYSRVPDGLLSYYRKHGFSVERIGITDPAGNPEGWQELEARFPQIYEAFKSLPKPVLVHCSAGCDRTGKAVEYVKARLAEESNNESG